ncbi:MAG: tetratricopeptide repeat protein [Acidimicrobiia bacterium]|nr:tetratricopeptide repeat protein [Acidimicrobiia bacterium]
MSDEVSRLREAIAVLEDQRALLGDDVVDSAVANLRPQLEKALATAEDQEHQRKQVTVLFADVSGFTRMSETMDHEDVAEKMNAIWASLDRIIVEHGGRVDKHIGDAVMALWGAPVARENDPERAVTAALAMQDALADFSPPGTDYPLQMRIGLNTGAVLVGTVGSTEEYTAIGHTVNLASRLESAAPAGGVLISHDTFALVSGLFNVVALEPITVKGVTEPVSTYHVRERKPREFRVGARGVAGVITPTVGREEELAVLTSALAPDLSSGSPTRLVTVMGEAGVGKSRLLYEFFNWLDVQERGTYLFRGRATADDEHDAYALLRDVVYFRYEIADSDSPGEAKSKLRSGLVAAAGEKAAQWAPFIGHVIGIDYSDDPAISGLLEEPRLILERAERHLRQAIIAGADDRYIVMLIEDIHWADNESLDLFERLADEATSYPFLMVANARPILATRRPEWVKNEDAWRRTVRLEALPASEADALFDSIFSRMAVVPPELRTMVVERSEGNPFYLEELVKMLIDDGAIAAGEEWIADESRLENLSIPRTLTGVLQARVDAMPRNERKALQDASVIGRVFWQDALVSILAIDMNPPPGPGDVAAWMASGQRRELVYQQQASDFADTREYIFKHAILHDVVYESVTRKLRRVYHAAIAAWLERRSAGRQGEFASRIAEHYARAGHDGERARWLVVAAHQARQSYAPEAAIRDYQQALDLWNAEPDGAPDPQTLLDTLEGLGDALSTRGRYEEAAAAFEELLRLAGADDDRAAEARGRHGLAVALAYKGDFRAGLEAAEAGATAARTLDDEMLFVRCRWMQSWCLLRLGELAQAEETVSSVVTASQALGNEAQLAKAQNLSGVLQYTKGNYDAATAAFEEAAATFRAMSSDESVMPILNNLGVLDEARGHYESAVGRYAEALDIAKSVGSRDGEMVYSSNLGMAKLGMGSTDEAESLFRNVIAMATSGLNVLSETHRGLAEALLKRGEIEEARLAALEALRLAVEAEAPDDEAGAWRLLGLVSGSIGDTLEVTSAGIGDTFDAEACFSKAVALAEEEEDESELARSLAAWGGWAARADLVDRAGELFESLGVGGELDRWRTAGETARSSAV